MNPTPMERMDCDLLVVGGGINGAGIARDAAGRGLKVVLCEQHDLAAHTSSASTKLIHGGLRYLEYYEFSLVRKALAESLKATLLASVADYQQMDKDRRFGREVWKPLLWAVLALCFIELLLVQWFRRQKGRKI